MKKDKSGTMGFGTGAFLGFALWYGILYILFWWGVAGRGYIQDQEVFCVDKGRNILVRRTMCMIVYEEWRGMKAVTSFCAQGIGTDAEWVL